MRTAQHLTHEEADAVRALAAEAERADGVAPLDEQTLLRLEPGSARSASHLLVTDEDGALVGYAQVADGSGELVVASAARRRGIGRELLIAARELGRPTGGVEPDAAGGSTDADADADADAGGGSTGAPAGGAEDRLAVWAHGDLPGAQALAAALGLDRVRELLRMGARVAPGPVPGAPAGVRIETFDVGRHAEAWLRVNARAFATHPEQGRMTRADLDERLGQPWFDPELLLLAFDEPGTDENGPVRTADDPGTDEDDDPQVADENGPARAADDPVGFIWMKPGDDGEAELYVLGVDPVAQGRGLGRGLTAVGLAEVAARGRTAVDLYVEGDNAPALATYERQGFDVVERHSQYA
ncbi:GNAT family N-acetyltransferase [Georgenia sp. Z1491]|uniref:GNAT family N-acetyltransferase n=1 Tax=Georgenia sp. Z1491 TaxID=3416707 RepID=UPI003CF9638B